MIRLRYPIGFGIAAATLVVLSMALVSSAAEALTRAEEAVSGSSSEQPTQDQFMAYYAEINLQYSIVELVPWIVLAAALTAIGALTLLVLRARQNSTAVPTTTSRERAR